MVKAVRTLIELEQERIQINDIVKRCIDIPENSTISPFYYALWYWDEGTPVIQGDDEADYIFFVRVKHFLSNLRRWYYE